MSSCSGGSRICKRGERQTPKLGVETIIWHICFPRELHENEKNIEPKVHQCLSFLSISPLDGWFHRTDHDQLDGLLICYDVIFREFPLNV